MDAQSELARLIDEVPPSRRPADTVGRRHRFTADEIRGLADGTLSPADFDER